MLHASSSLTLPNANAQELDVPIDLAITDSAVVNPITTGNEGESYTPPDGQPLEAGLPVSDWWDSDRLAVKTLQDISLETTGEYTQVTLDERIIGETVSFDSIKSTFDGRQEVHVYEAPCGKGWQLIVHDTLYGYQTSTSTGKEVTELLPYDFERSYGYGCEHIVRTFNW